MRVLQSRGNTHHASSGPSTSDAAPAASICDVAPYEVPDAGGAAASGCRGGRALTVRPCGGTPLCAAGAPADACSSPPAAGSLSCLDVTAAGDPAFKASTRLRGAAGGPEASSLLSCDAIGRAVRTATTRPVWRPLLFSSAALFLRASCSSSAADGRGALVRGMGSASTGTGAAAAALAVLTPPSNASGSKSSGVLDRCTGTEEATRKRCCCCSTRLAAAAGCAPALPSSSSPPKTVLHKLRSCSSKGWSFLLRGAIWNASFCDHLPPQGRGGAPSRPVAHTQPRGHAVFKARVASRPRVVVMVVSRASLLLVPPSRRCLVSVRVLLNLERCAQCSASASACAPPRVRTVKLHPARHGDTASTVFAHFAETGGVLFQRTRSA